MALEPSYIAPYAKGIASPVLTKVLRNSHATLSELVAFRNQYVVTQQLDSPLVTKSLGLEPWGNGYTLIMPDAGAVV